MNTGEYPLSDFAEMLKVILADGGHFKMYPKGNSMLPLIRSERDAVILSAPEKLAVNDVILFRRTDGSCVLHRIIEQTDGGLYVVRGDSQLWSEPVSPEQILAKIAEIRRGRHVITPDRMLYRIYMFLWSRYLPRRCYVLCRRLRHRFGKKPEGAVR